MKTVLMLTAATAAIVVAGCVETEGDPVIPLEDVVIVSVTNDADWDSNNRTVVEFPDGTRRWRPHIWGEVGDEFKAKRDGARWY